jgi:hypothetical protein
MALKLGYNVSNFALELGGKTAGYLSSFQAPSYEVEEISQGLGPDWVAKKMHGNPKIGEATASFNISQTGYLLDWVASVWRKDCMEMDAAVMLADQNYEIKRRIDMMRCLISGVEFPALDAKDGKKHLEITVKFKPEELKYTAGGGKLQGTLGTKAKNWLVSNWKITIPGIKSEYVTKVELPKLTPKIAEEAHGAFRLPTRHYASIEISSMKVEISSAGFEDAKNMAVKVIQDGVISESEYFDILIDMYDQSMKNVLGTFTCIGCGLKKFDWAAKLEGGKEGMALSTLEFMVEEFNFDVKHKTE